MQRSSQIFRAVSFTADLLWVNTCFLLACSWQGLLDVFWLSSQINIVFWLYLNLTWYAATSVMRTYELERTARISTVMKQLLLAILVLGSSLSFFVVLTEYYDISRSWLLEFFGAVVAGLVGWRLVYLWLARMVRRAGYNYRTVVLVGYNKAAHELALLFKTHPEYGYRVAGYFDNIKPEHLSTTDRPAYLGSLSGLEAYLTHTQIDEVYYASGQGHEAAYETPYESPYLRHLVHFAEALNVGVKLVPDFKGFGPKEVQLDYYHHLPIVTFKKEPLEYAHNQFIKRSFDVAFSLLVILGVLSWLLPILALIIKADSRGPIFFRQRRTGKDNKDFWCYKFRTMYVNAEADRIQATKGDRRVTRLGAFLRKSNLDELPQFFNVLLGDMSVVGPRPHMLSHTETFGQSIENYMVRHLIKPGITGLAQAKGYRGETQTLWDIKSRVRVDIFYIEHWSFYLDLQVLVLTVTQMLKGNKNAY